MVRNRAGTKSKTPVQGSCRFWKKLEDALWARVGENQWEMQVQGMLGFTIEVAVGEKENLG